MLKQMTENPSCVWLSLGGLLLIAEMLGAGCYLLWSGLAAIIVGLLLFILPCSLVSQGTIFAVFTIFSAFWWWYWLMTLKKAQQGLLLNHIALQMIGLRTKLIEPTNNGYSRVRVADGSWRIYCSMEMELSAGTEVEVISINGNTLHVIPLDILKKQDLFSTRHSYQAEKH